MLLDILHTTSKRKVKGCKIRLPRGPWNTTPPSANPSIGYPSGPSYICQSVLSNSATTIRKYHISQFNSCVMINVGFLLSILLMEHAIWITVYEVLSCMSYHAQIVHLMANGFRNWTQIWQPAAAKPSICGYGFLFLKWLFCCLMSHIAGCRFF